MSLAPRWTAREDLIDLLQYPIITNAPANQVEVSPDDHQKIVEVVSQPPVSWPTTSIFCAWCSSASRALTYRDLIG